MNKMAALMAIAATVAFSGNVLAHGEKPKHGGVISSASDLNFELVSKDGKAIVYVDDHGKPLATTGATGKLTILNGAAKSELPLEPSGENTLTTKGEATLSKGAKAIAAITFANKKTVNARFSVK